MPLLPAAIVFALILGGGLLAHTASGSPAVLLSVSGGVFLIALFAKFLAVALPIAAGAGLVTFAFALQGYVPWIGVAEALFLIAWAGSARIRHPIPAALAAGFFGALVLAFEIWRGWTGDMIAESTRPVLAIASALAGFALLIPSYQDHASPFIRAIPRRPLSKHTPLTRSLGAALIATLGIVLTVALTTPMGTFAAHLREAFGGAPADITETEIAVSGGPGSRWSSDSGRPLPRRANVNLKHEFELLIRTENTSDASHLASRQIYCRAIVLGKYVADRWLPPESTDWFDDPMDGTIDRQVRIAAQPPTGIKKIPHSVFIPASPEMILPTLQGVVSFQLPRVIRIGESTFGHPSRLESALSYQAVSATRIAGEIPPQNLRAAAAPTPDSIQLPDDTTGARVRNLAASLSPPGTPLPVIIDRIRRHLDTTTTYSTVIENPKNLPPLENFLFDEQRGYCEFYATAGALLLRASGVPARVAYGFSSGEQTADPRAFAFFTDDAHAWTEILVEDIGWCIVDFTPEGFGAATPPAPAGPLSPRVDQTSFASLSEIDQNAENNWAAGIDPDGWTLAEWGILITIALLLGGIAVTIFRRDPLSQTSRSGANSHLSTQSREPGFYRTFCDAAAKAGFPKHPGQTPKEHLSELARSSPEQAEKFAPLVDYYYAVRYEGADPDRSRERSFKGAAGRLSKSGKESP